jgi:hypothetical protein
MKFFIIIDIARIQGWKYGSGHDSRCCPKTFLGLKKEI